MYYVFIDRVIDNLMKYKPDFFPATITTYVFSIYCVWGMRLDTGLKKTQQDSFPPGVYS